jgi:transitional endoplasmic reticulum ATPase
MSDPLLPSWADELRTRYQAGASSIFLAHGAITDLQAFAEDGADAAWLEPSDFMHRFLGRTRPVVVFDVEGGVLTFSSGESESEVRARLNLRRKARGLDAIGSWPTDPREVLPLLKEMLVDRSYRIAVVVHGVEKLAPAESGPPEAELTRGRVYDLVYDAPAGLLNGDGLLVLTTSDIEQVDPRVRSAARVAAVAVPLPDFRALRQFVEHRLGESDHDAGHLAAGLVGRSFREAGRVVAKVMRGDDPVEAAAAPAEGPSLPPWADDLRERYLAGEASMFLVHGNVRDVYPWEDSSGEVTYVTLRQFLERFLARAKEMVAYYNVSEGIEFPVPGMQERFLDAINTRRRKLGRAPRSSMSQVGDQVLSTFEELITGGDEVPSAAIILDYVEMVVPMGDLSFMGDQDKSNLVALQRWSSDPAFLDSDNVVVLCTENLPDVHRRLVASPQLAAIQVPLPSEEERLAYIRSIDHTGIDLEMPDDALAKVTAGLSLVQVRGLFRRARRSGEKVTFRTVSRRKKSIIEQECHGLVEFVDPNHNFSHVGGMDRLKGDLMRVAMAIKNGHRNRVPMGIIFVGPMGTGKTFMAEAFAAESGLTCLKFKNFREKWVGSTEGNLEKILQVVEGLGYVLLIVDEADRSMGSATDGDGGTSSRVIARLKEFMSDTGHRGRIVVLMMTNRPDKLDADLKRPGRFDLKIPFFFPEDHDERKAVLEALARKNKLSLAEDTDLDAAAQGTAGYSGAELESVLLAAAGNAADADHDTIQAEHLAQAVTDVIPSRDTRMLEFMEMLAVFESTNRRMLPERFQDLDTDAVHKRLDALRMQLGRRV